MKFPSDNLQDNYDPNLAQLSSDYWKYELTGQIEFIEKYNDKKFNGQVDLSKSENPVLKNIKKVKHVKRKSKEIMEKKVSYSEYELSMQEKGRKGYDYMYEKESTFLRLREEALDKLLAEKLNSGAIKAYLFIWRMAYKHKHESLYWTASENEIAKELKLANGTVSTGLDQLEKHGLIKKEPARHERSAYTYIIQPLA